MAISPRSSSSLSICSTVRFLEAGFLLVVVVATGACRCGGVGVFFCGVFVVAFDLVVAGAFLTGVFFFDAVLDFGMVNVLLTALSPKQKKTIGTSSVIRKQSEVAVENCVNQPPTHHRPLNMKPTLIGCAILTGHLLSMLFLFACYSTPSTGST